MINTTNNKEIRKADSEDIEYLLVEVEQSFNIKFVGNELAHASTLGDIFDHIANKINLEDSETCTSQQAFYKLRNILASETGFDKITPGTRLKEILPRKNRAEIIRRIEEKVGFKLSILGPPSFVTLRLLTILLVSTTMLFFNGEKSLEGLAFSIFALWLSRQTGNELEIETVGELARKITTEHYLGARRNTATYNKREVEKVLSGWFIERLGLEPSSSIRDVKISHYIY